MKMPFIGGGAVTIRSSLGFLHPPHRLLFSLLLLTENALLVFVENVVSGSPVLSAPSGLVDEAEF